MKYAVLLFIPLGIAAFVGFWCLIVKGLALVGWQRLATHFQVPALLPGPQYTLGQAGIGGVGYNNAIRASVTSEGLGLRTPFLFRPGHPPVLIPWAALSPLEAKKFLWQTTYLTTVHTPTGGTVSLRFSSEEVARAVRPWLSSS